MTVRALLETVLRNTPAAIAVCRGPTHVLEYVNPAWERMIGRPGVLAKPVGVVVPELAASGVLDVLDHVYSTGAPYSNPELKLRLQRATEVHDVTWDIVVHRVANDPAASRGHAVFLHALDVTAGMRARSAMEALLLESEGARQALLTAHAQLQAQSAELRAANAQLQEQAVELEAQTVELETTAHELELRSREAERAVVAMRESEQQLRAMVDLAHDSALRTRQLQSLTAALAGARTVDDIARIVVAEATSATNAMTGMLAVRVPGTNEGMILQQSGLNDEVLARFARFSLDDSGSAPYRLRTGESVFAESRDTLEARFPELRPLIRRQGIGALATVPLNSADETIGVMSFTYAAPRTFGSDERAFFLALAAQAAQALERVRLAVAEREARSQSEAAERRAAFLAEASARLAHSLDVEATLHAVAELSVPALADWCFVEVLEKGVVRPAAVAHSDPAMVQFAHDVIARYPIDLNAPFGTGKVIRTGEPDLVPDIPDEALASVAQDEEHLALVRQVGLRSMIQVPLLGTAGETIGALSFVSTDPVRRYNEADLAMANEVARRAGAALASARLYAAEQAALRRATALHQVAAALAGALTEKEVADSVVHHGRVAVGAAAGSLAVLTADGTMFEMLSTEGYDAESTRRFQSFPLAPGRPLSDAVISNSPSYLSSLEETALQFPDRYAALRDTGFESYVALPVGLGGRPSAALSFSFVERRDFDPEDRAFLETLAAQAAQWLERAKLVQAERQAREAAESANRAKTDFLSTMSHELRTPLNAIGGYAELLELGLRGPVTDAQREDLARIRRAGQHLQSLINDILNFARLEAGFVDFDVQDVRVVDALVEVEELVMPQLRARELSYRRVNDDTQRAALPSVRADREKLRQILLNLLTNAMKFTPPGGLVSIGCEADSNDDGAPRMVRLYVADTGRGIPQSELPRIFEPFVQVDRGTSGASQQGVGLGLSISRNLARAMGGELSVVSVLGQGSTFTLTLPAVPQRAEAVTVQGGRIRR